MNVKLLLHCCYSTHFSECLFTIYSTATQLWKHKKRYLNELISELAEFILSAFVCKSRTLIGTVSAVGEDAVWALWTYFYSMKQAACRVFFVECWTNSPYCISRLTDAGRMCCARLVTNSLYLRANTLLTYCEANRQVQHWNSFFVYLFENLEEPSTMPRPSQCTQNQLHQTMNTKSCTNGSETISATRLTWH